jgi:serine O-acetyltransferase
MIRHTIQDVVAEITETCMNEEIYVTSDEDIRLPNRGIIIGIIKDLRRVVFPGYFGDENISSTMPDYFLGNMLTQIYEALRLQVEIAFLYDDKGNTDREKISEKAKVICERFISRLPYIQKMLLLDVQAGFDGDPAAKSKEDIIFSYPGLFAIYVYRIAHELYVQHVPFIPRIMTEYAHGKTGIDINSGAEIGQYFFIDHGTGIVIGETTIIGDFVKLYQGVTLGALSTRNGQQLAGLKRHPTIGDHVTIYANSTILGGETVIGEYSVVGGNSFITQSVAPYTRVSIKSPELTFGGTKKTEQENLWE